MLPSWPAFVPQHMRKPYLPFDALMKLGGLDMTFAGIHCARDFETRTTAVFQSPAQQHAGAARPQQRHMVENRGEKRASSGTGPKPACSPSGASATSCDSGDALGTASGIDTPVPARKRHASAVLDRLRGVSVDARTMLGVVEKSTYRCRKCGLIKKGHTCPYLNVPSVPTAV